MRLLKTLALIAISSMSAVSFAAERPATSMEVTLFNIFRNDSVQSCISKYHHVVEKRDYYADISYIVLDDAKVFSYKALVEGVETPMMRIEMDGRRRADESLHIGFVSKANFTVSLDANNNVKNVYCTMGNDEAGIVKESSAVEPYVMNKYEKVLITNLEMPYVKHCLAGLNKSIVATVGAMDEEENYEGVQGNVAVNFGFEDGKGGEIAFGVLRNGFNGRGLGYGCE